MAEFQPITTQEELDAVLGSRLKRAKEQYSKEYEGYMSADEVDKIKRDYDKQIVDLNEAIKSATEKAEKYDADIAERDSRIKAYETASIKSRIAHEVGLSYESIDFLRGDDEESIKKSAESLKNLVSGGATAPLASSEHKPSSNQHASRDAVIKDLAKNLLGEN